MCLPDNLAGSFVVMAGHKRKARLRQLDPAIHVFHACDAGKTWMPEQDPA
jgi:hypothetical protein